MVKNWKKLKKMIKTKKALVKINLMTKQSNLTSELYCAVNLEYKGLQIL